MADDITLAEHFSGLAKRFRTNAGNEKNQELKAEWERLANCYIQLANRTDQDRLSEWARRLSSSQVCNENA